MKHVTRIAIIGGGPGGYEAALVAAQLGADVTVVERDGLGGACVLTDCVPSKTLIASAEPGADAGDMVAINERVRSLARAQSVDVEERLRREGVTVLAGEGRLAAPNRVVVDGADVLADAVLV